MLKLCGFAISNYYNKVKLSLLEKGVPFEDEPAYPSQKDEFLAESSMGKVPFLRTDRGILTESQVLTEYIEDAYPEPALFPQDFFERARCRELIQHIELHLELPARRLYGEAFFGGKASDETKQEVEKLLTRGLRSLEAPGALRALHRRRRVHPYRLRGLGAPAPGVADDENHLRPRHARGSPAPGQGLHQDDRRAAARADGQRRPQGGIRTRAAAKAAK
ncbi:MAG: glutathione S-transferase family protein [Rhodocyclaceae bacterium]|nr:glutathione S-transferase family protein [Rhodocyclaceae bacterium]